MSSALLMPNCAEYLAVWLGLTRLGVTVALANTHLAGDALAHCINIVARAVIVGAELAATLAAVRARLPANVPVLGPRRRAAGYGAAGPALRLPGRSTVAAARMRAAPLDATALYIYTSGTTGPAEGGQGQSLPADAMEPLVCGPARYAADGPHVQLPAALSQRRRRRRDRCDAGRRRRGRDPRAILGVGFLARCRDERCTLFQYIGELCRYLVNAPPHRIETATFAAHRLRQRAAAGGLGAVPDALSDPADSRVLRLDRRQFLALQLRGAAGAIGRIPLVPRASPAGRAAALRSRAGEPLRNAAGFCERCADEVGEAVGLIPREGAARRPLRGLRGPEATERKVLRNVFKPGDAWYRTGDLMRRDARRLLLLRGPRRRDLSLEGRKRLDGRGAVGARGAPGVLEGVVYGVASAGRRRARRHGRAGRWRGVRSRGVSSRASSSGCRPMRGRCSCGCCRRSNRPAPSSRPSRASTSGCLDNRCQVQFNTLEVVS
jgi:fatty-acyl-CoA synthase